MSGMLMLLKSLGIDPDEVFRVVREAESSMLEIRGQLNRIEETQKEILERIENGGPNNE